MQLHIHVFCFASLVFQRNFVNILLRRTICFLIDFSAFVILKYLLLFCGVSKRTATIKTSEKKSRRYFKRRLLRAIHFINIINVLQYKVSKQLGYYDLDRLTPNILTICSRYEDTKRVNDLSGQLVDICR